MMRTDLNGFCGSAFGRSRFFVALPRQSACSIFRSFGFLSVFLSKIKDFGTLTECIFLHFMVKYSIYAYYAILRI